MKHFSLIILSCLPFESEAQPNTVKPEIDITTVAPMVGVAGVKTVRQQFGQAKSEKGTRESVVCQYTQGAANFTFRFNPGDTLVFFAADYPTNTPDSLLTATHIRAIRTVKHYQELTKKLGQPARVSMTPTENLWFFHGARQGAGTSELMVRFKPGATVADIRYDTQGDIESDIQLKQVETLRTGISHTSEIEKTWGAPSHMAITRTGEKWTYKSKTALLVLSFDGSGKLTDYLLETDE